MTVYADILFLVDASMDLVAVWLCARLLHRSVTIPRLLLASAAGGVGSVILLFMPQSAAITFCGGVLISSAMTVLAFGRQKRRLFFILWITLWGCATLLGGLLTMLMRLGQPVYAAAGSASYPLFYGAAFGICTLCMRFWRQKRYVRTAKLHIRHGSWQADVEALVDTGNLVVDPCSGTPVVFLAASSAPDFPISDMLRLEDCPAWFARTIRIIPTKTIHGERSMTGFLAEECIVNGIARRAVVVVERSADYGSCGALCPASLCSI